MKIIAINSSGRVVDLASSCLAMAVKLGIPTSTISKCIATGSPTRGLCFDVAIDGVDYLAFDGQHRSKS